MSISGQNLSAVIVTLKSEKVIDKCINSIGHKIPIIVVENSNNHKFKQDLESRYKNLKCILSGSNIGMGAGNNIGIKAATTDYVIVLNPDVILEPHTLEELYKASEKLNEFTVLSPINVDLKFPNYKTKKNPENADEPFEVDYVDGFSMLLNRNKFNQDRYFDENFFLYLENDDLCIRVKRAGGSIYIAPKAKINHEGSKAIDSKYKDEIELSRNWHWIWSKFYFNKKNFGFYRAIIECLPSYISSLLKILFYTLIKNDFKKKIYLNRASGFLNALLGKSSWYRPKIDN